MAILPTNILIKKVTTMIPLEEQLKAVRKLNNLTQEEIAKIFDVTPQTIANWEMGKTFIRRNLRPSVEEWVKNALRTNEFLKSVRMRER